MIEYIRRSSCSLIKRKISVKQNCHNCTVLDHKETEGHAIIRIQDATDVRLQTLEAELLRSHATQAEIQNVIQAIEYEMQTIQTDKDSATENLVTFFQFAQGQLERCQQEAIGAITQHHAAQHCKLMGKQRQLEQACVLLQKQIKQSEQITKTNDINYIMSSKAKLEKATKIATLDIIHHRGNISTSDLVSGTNLHDEKLYGIGNTCFQSLLPMSVAFTNNEFTTGLKSAIRVELFDDTGNKVLIVRPFLAVHITDPQQEKLPVTLNTAHPECTVTITPQVSGRHEIYFMCMGQQGKSEGFGSCDRPSNLKLDSNLQFFRPCDHEI